MMRLLLFVRLSNSLLYSDKIELFLVQKSCRTSMRLSNFSNWDPIKTPSSAVSTST